MSGAGQHIPIKLAWSTLHRLLKLVGDRRTEHIAQAAQAGRRQVKVPTITVLGVKAALAALHRVQHVQVKSACQAAAISPEQSACHASKIAGKDCSKSRQSPL